MYLGYLNTYQKTNLRIKINIKKMKKLIDLNLFDYYFFLLIK